MKKFVCFCFAALFAASLCGAELLRARVTAPYIPGGKIKKPAAKIINADNLHGDRNAYALRLALGLPADLNRLPRELGAVSCSYDDKYFYVNMNLNDSDVFNDLKQDGSEFSRNGDAVIIYLKAAKLTGFWEITVAPTGGKSCRFYPGTGCMLPAFTENCDASGIKVALDIKGKLNCPKGTDQAWQVNVAIPRSIFAAKKCDFSNKEKWTVLFSRTNYSAILPGKENSSFPQVTRGLATERFAELDLLAK